jgi:hypothetical protein
VQDKRSNKRAEAGTWNHPQETRRSESDFQKLIQGLREELAECGAMLVILDQQQKLILQRQTKALLEHGALMSACIDTLAAARMCRRRLSLDLGAKLGVPGFASWGELIARSPSQDQCLLRALVGEINWVLCQCQRRLQQNKLLLSPPNWKSLLIKHAGGLVCFGLN